ncbi:hypothetical protein EST38_g4557 [Candolleomyces aberdarensis]|uniref:Uncharacterized protein n=1 Tax=Candolleomyces aberdarensis TaxID=2316362 RepID=A0A4Q2DMP5_9AGAR|nr:hypothetical protein EST38_g4557 [Candolleomyces aberdarensis]
MSLWTRLWYSSSTTQVVTSTEENGHEIQKTTIEVQEISRRSEIVAPISEQSPAELSVTESRTTAVVEEAVEAEETQDQVHTPAESPRRFNFKRISFSRKSPTDDKPALSTIQEHERREHAVEAAARHQKQEKLSKSDLRARKNALRVRMLITGEPTGSLPAVSPVVAKPQLNKIKTQLSEPKTANKLIQELRRLPATTQPGQSGVNHDAPIHAVCLEFTDAEEDSIHFAKLQCGHDHSAERLGKAANGNALNFSLPNVSSASVDQLTSLLNEMHVIEIMKAPDLGLGQPGDGDGLLAGAVPTPETVLKGVKEITPTLMALGYATGRAILPDHAGIYPPTDRISVLTYWWGLEILLPTPTLEYLSRVQSITTAVVNFLSAMALVNNGVREILPFVRYIAQFVEFEFNSIRTQDKGKGVICAATWIMPAALVPRPWDFPDPPPPATPKEGEETNGEEGAESPPVPPKSPKTPPKSSTSAPSLPKPRPVSSILDIVAQARSPSLKDGKAKGDAKVSQTPSPALRSSPSVPVQA